MNAAPHIDPRVLPANRHTFLGIGELHARALVNRYGDTPCLHIGTRAGPLSIRAQRDSAGIEITAEQATSSLGRVMSGCRALFTDHTDIEIAVVRRPNALTDELHIGDHWFELPRNYTNDAVWWLRQHAPRHTRPFDPTEVTP